MSGNDQLSLAIVRVWALDASVAGVGFLIADRTILTCAHVVAGALGIADDNIALRESSIGVDFALIRRAAWKQQRATVASLPSISYSARFPSDIAVLMLDDDAPEESAPLPLLRVTEVRGHRFETFGFPALSGDNGDWAEGAIVGVGSTGLLQIRGEGQQGRRVQQGFSGAPIWDMDLECVVGMVAEADRIDGDRVAYAIPVWDLSSSLTDFLELPQCPYRGLEAFQEIDADSFFGRDDFISRLLDNIGERPLLAIAGPSGIGKSSVLAAGLSARLQQQGCWNVIKMRPKKFPLYELAIAILPLLEPGLTPVEQLDKARVLAQSIHDYGLEACLASLSHMKLLPMLLIVDQLEELFTSSSDTDSQAFIDVLIRAADQSRNFGSFQLCIVLAMRSDFLDEALGCHGLADVISPVEVLGNMDFRQLRSAIEKPAFNNGVEFEGGLVERILTDTPDTAQLPLVEFLLTSLWNHQENHILTHSTYQELGGVGGALAQHAEEVFGKLSQRDQGRAKEILLRLVTVSASNAPATCRVADRTEFPDGDDWKLIQHFANQRLVLTDRDHVEHQTAQIVHEAIISKWDRLSDWVTEDRKRLIARDEVRAAATRWVAKDRDASWLVRGRALSEAEDYWNNDPPSINDSLITEFLIKSRITETKGKNGTRSPDMARTLKKAVQMSQKTSDIELQVHCLTEAINFHLQSFEPIRAFHYWQRYYQLNFGFQGVRTSGSERRLDRQVKLIWVIAVEIFPLPILWLLSWFGIASLFGASINYGEHSKTVRMLAVAFVVSLIFWFTRRGFRHWILAFPVALLTSELIVELSFVRNNYAGIPYIKGQWWTAIAAAGLLVLLWNLLKRYRAWSKMSREDL